MITLYNVVSADGYIARKDGSEDFIPDSYWPQTLAVLKQYDCIMLGRKSYEAIQSYEKEFKDSFDNLAVKKVIVTEDKNFKVKQGYTKVNSPEEAIRKDLNIVVTSGPTLNQYLLDKNLVDKIIVHEVPESIGDGIKPYRSMGRVKSVRLHI